MEKIRSKQFKGAITGGLINVLITDVPTAELLLNNLEKI